MQVWIDQDWCTGAGLCVDRCPDLFIVHEDGIGYVYDDGGVVSEPGQARPVPARYEDAAIDAAEQCPGECIYLEADPSSPLADDTDIHDAELVVDLRQVGVMPTPSQARDSSDGGPDRR